MEARKTDEIDLAELLTKIIRALKRNIKLILILSITGFLMGIASTFWVKKTYASKMLVSSDILTFSYAEKLIKTLDELIEDKNLPQLSKRLGLTEKDAGNIRKIIIETAIDQKSGLPEKEKNYLLITVEIWDKNLLPALQNGLTSYLENNDFVRIRVKQNKELYTQLIKGLENEIKSLEELKNKIYEGNFFENLKGNMMFDPTMVNSKIIELTKEKIDNQRKLELVNSIHVVEGFTPFIKSVNARKGFSAITGFFAGLVLALAIIGISNFNKVIKLTEERLAQQS